MASRKARRSSILKTRFDGGPEEGNSDNGDGGTTKNLTGLINRRRVSFSHTNQVKEFEKSNNSSTEGSMSKTADFDQTMIGDMNMSMDTSHFKDNLENDNDGREEGNVTRMGVEDMSLYQVPGPSTNLESSTLNRTGNRTGTSCGTKPYPARADPQKFQISYGQKRSNYSSTEDTMSKRSDLNQTMMCDMNMSMDNSNVGGNQETIGREANITRMGAEEMSIYQAPPARSINLESNANRAGAHKRKSVGVETKLALAPKGSLSMTADFNQTRIGGRNMSMDITNFNENWENDYNGPEEGNLTRMGVEDMSMYQAPGPSTTIESSTENRTIAHTRKSVGTKLSLAPKGSLSMTTDFNQTRVGDRNMNMDITHFKDNQNNDHNDRQEGNVTRMGLEDMLMYQSPVPSPSSTNLECSNGKRAVAHTRTSCGTNLSMAPKSSLSMTADFNQTRIGGRKMSMDITHFKENQENDNKGDEEGNITRMGVEDMSMYEVPSTTTNSESFTENQVVSQTEKSCGTKLYLAQTDSQQVLHPFGKRKSSYSHTEVQMSKTTDFVQTIVGDRNISVDISHFQENRETDNVLCDEGNVTRMGVDDISMYQVPATTTNLESSTENRVATQTGKSRGTNICLAPTDSQQFLNPFGKGKSNYSLTEGALSRTTDFVRTIMGDRNMSVDVSHFQENRETENILGLGDLTKMGSEEMSVHQAPAPSANPVESSTEIRTVAHPEKSCGTKLYFAPTDPQQFLNPFGQEKSIKVNKRMALQPELVPQLSFGKFGSAKTPKRNKIPIFDMPESSALSHLSRRALGVKQIDAQTSPFMDNLYQKSPVVNAKPRSTRKRLVDVQTSPMVQGQQVATADLPIPPTGPVELVDVQTSPMVQGQQVDLADLPIPPTGPVELVDVQTSRMEAHERAVRKPSSRRTSMHNVDAHFQMMQVSKATAINNKPLLQTEPVSEVELQHPKKNASENTASINKSVPSTEPIPEVGLQLPKENASAKPSSINKPVPSTEPIPEVELQLPTKNASENTTSVSKPVPPTEPIPEVELQLLEKNAIKSLKYVRKTPVFHRGVLQTPPIVPSESLNTDLMNPISLDSSKRKGLLQTPPIIVQTQPKPPEVLQVQTQPKAPEVLQAQTQPKPPEVLQVQTQPKAPEVLQAQTQPKLPEVPHVQTESICKVVARTVSPPPIEQSRGQSAVNFLPDSTSEAFALTPPMMQPQAKIRTETPPLSRPESVNKMITLSPSTLQTPPVIQPGNTTKSKLPTESINETFVPQTPSMLEASVAFAEDNEACANYVESTRIEPSASFRLPATPGPSNRRHGFVAFKNKLNKFANDDSLGVFEKWEFLDKAHDKMARMSQDEWNEILKTDKVRNYLGETFIRAVNIERSRLNDPDPLYQAAMQSIKQDERNAALN